MRNTKSKILAILLACGMMATYTACGSGNDDEDTAENATVAADEDTADADDAAQNGNNDAAADDEVDLEAMLKQDLVIEDYDVSLDAENSAVPVNRGAAQDADQEVMIVVTNAAGEAETDSDGTTMTEVVTKSELNGEIPTVVTNAAGEAETNSDGSIVTEIVTYDNSYTSSISGKQLYWMDMSEYEDFVFNGDFIDVVFRVKDDTPDGDYTIGIGTCDFANYDAIDLGYSSANATVAVGDAELPENAVVEGDGPILLSAENVAADPGDEFVVRFQINENPGVVAFIFRFTYDQNAFEYVGLTVGEDCEDYITLAN